MNIQVEVGRDVGREQAGACVGFLHEVAPGREERQEQPKEQAQHPQLACASTDRRLSPSPVLSRRRRLRCSSQPGDPLFGLQTARLARHRSGAEDLSDGRLAAPLRPYGPVAVPAIEEQQSAVAVDKCKAVCGSGHF